MFIIIFVLFFFLLIHEHTQLLTPKLKKKLNLNTCVFKLHRVKNPSVEEASSSRLSLVFFSGPKEDALIEPMAKFETDKDITDNLKHLKYKPVRCGDFLRDKLKSSNV